MISIAVAVPTFFYTISGNIRSELLLKHVAGLSPTQSCIIINKHKEAACELLCRGVLIYDHKLPNCKKKYTLLWAPQDSKWMPEINNGKPQWAIRVYPTVSDEDINQIALRLKQMFSEENVENKAMVNLLPWGQPKTRPNKEGSKKAVWDRLSFAYY